MYLIYMQNVVCYQCDMPDGLNFESTHTQMSYILYFFKISNHQTLKGQCDMPDGLNFESTHTQMSYILYFFKISKLQTIKGQCGLEGIVIKPLSGINQFKDKITTNSQYPSMFPSQEEWGPIDTTF